MIDENGGVCAACWQQLNFIAAPYCKRCGYPYEYEMGEGAECAACIAQLPHYHGHRSVLYFDELTKKLIYDLKYYDKPLLVGLFGQWLEQISSAWLEHENLLIIPTPIHRFRLWKRKYNQASLLANALAARTGHEVLHNGLLRTHHRPPQASLSRQKRLTNLKGSLAINTKHKDAIKGRPILLIDDVMTTGATVNACAKLLKQAGSGKVYCVTIARSVLEG